MKYLKVECGDIEKRINEIKGKSGVWFLLGRENESSPLVCLQVAQKDNIGNEIENDVRYLRTKVLKPGKKEYVNQFGEKQFDYEDWGQYRARKLYYNIAHKYSDLTFVCIWDEKIFEDKSNRELLEKYIAYKTKAVFWVNGRPFKKELTDDEKKELLIKYSNECNRIKKNLIEMIGKDKITEIDKIIVEG